MEEKQYTFHEVSSLFPLMQGIEFDQLVTDVKAHGLREAIWLYEDKIIDGRNRYRACEAAGIEPRFREWDGNGSPTAFVLSENLHRRHLNESQRAMVAARMATLANGQRADYAAASQICEAVTQAQAADMLHVGKRSVEHARAVLNTGTPALIGAVDAGLLPVSLAARLTDAPADFQQAVVQKLKTVPRPMEAIRQVRTETIREKEAIMPSGKYRVLYADPPWSYSNTQPDYHREQRDHYAVMSLEEICQLPIQEVIEDDAVLFLWVTSPILEDSFRVIKAWGFAYKASFVWDKIKHNMGHYNSVRHELVLVCTRGRCQPDVQKLFDSVITEERTEHSTKPAIFYDIIDTLYPHGKRVELFARGKRHPGWEIYGNQAE